MNTPAPKKQQTRVYLVENNECQVPKRLVRSSSPAQVARHVTKTMFTIRVADQDDLIDSLQAGVKVEDTDEEPEPAKVVPAIAPKDARKWASPHQLKRFSPPAAADPALRGLPTAVR